MVEYDIPALYEMRYWSMLFLASTPYISLVRLSPKAARQNSTGLQLCLDHAWLIVEHTIDGFIGAHQENAQKNHAATSSPKTIRLNSAHLCAMSRSYFSNNRIIFSTHVENSCDSVTNAEMVRDSFLAPTLVFDLSSTSCSRYPCPYIH